jgi:CDP-diacylglycerol--serine O-phosphatidyltransferase
MNEPGTTKDQRRLLRRRHRRTRILQATAVLPSLATIFNGLSGFAAIHFATKLKLGENSPEAVQNLMIAAAMLFLAMVFDLLDGRLARMTRRTSDFGAQLDSLCDMVSFGLAPAVLALHAVIAIFRDPALDYRNIVIERIVWSIMAVYVACAAMRLARFNVENEPDESAHFSFKGLPSPGAAAATASLVLLYAWLKSDIQAVAPWLWFTLAAGISFVTLSCGLLMVSRFRYPHVVNQFIRGKRPFAYLVKLVFLVGAALVFAFLALEPTIAALTIAYVFSGPIAALWRLWRKPAQSPLDTKKT